MIDEWSLNRHIFKELHLEKLIKNEEEAIIKHREKITFNTVHKKAACRNKLTYYLKDIKEENEND
jgi:hypothetical protein